MDPLYPKAQKQLGGSSSKASSKGSARKARKKKKSKAQNAGQPSGRSISSSGQSRSRPEAEEEHEEETLTPRAGGESPMASKAASYAVGALHGIDIGLGLALIIYGAMVQLEPATALSIAYGLLLLLGAVAGAIGYYSGACNRRGLMASAITGLLACLLDIGAFIAIFVSWDSFIKFLDDNQKEFMLTEDSVETIQGLKILFVVIFVVLAVLEGCRFRFMWVMNGNMRGSSGKVTPLSNSTRESPWKKFLSRLGLAKRKKTDDFVVFNDDTSLESSLLWSKDGAQPTSDDYLEFVPEHEKSLAEYASNAALPKPADDVDY